jgi:hypothetical protein
MYITCRSDGMCGYDARPRPYVSVCNGIDCMYLRNTYIRALGTGWRHCKSFGDPSRWDMRWDGIPFTHCLINIKLLNTLQIGTPKVWEKPTTSPEGAGDMTKNQLSPGGPWVGDVGVPGSALSQAGNERPTDA